MSRRTYPKKQDNVLNLPILSLCVINIIGGLYLNHLEEERIKIPMYIN